MNPRRPAPGRHALQLAESLDLFVDGVDIAFDVAAQHDDVVGLYLELTLNPIHGVLQRLFQALVVGVRHGLKLGHLAGEFVELGHAAFSRSVASVMRFHSSEMRSAPLVSLRMVSLRTATSWIFFNSCADWAPAMVSITDLM